MHLTTARLCLNCDDVHEANACPMCASETFVYLTRWVPLAHPESRPVVKPGVAATVAQRAIEDGARSRSVLGLDECFRRVQTRVELMALRKAGELR